MCVCICLFIFTHVSIYIYVHKTVIADAIVKDSTCLCRLHVFPFSSEKLDKETLRTGCILNH